MNIQEKIVDWIVMLDSPDFKGTDADIVRNEMLALINVNSQQTKSEDKSINGLIALRTKSPSLPTTEQNADNIQSKHKAEIDEDYTISGDDVCENCGHERSHHGKCGCHHSRCKCSQFALEDGGVK